VGVCMGNWLNKCDHPCALNFIYCLIHVVAIGCGMFVFG